MSNTVYYLQVNITCLVVLGMIFVSILRENYHSLRSKLYRWLIAMTMVFCASDLVAGAFRGQLFPGARQILWGSNIIYLVSTIFLAFLWVYYSMVVLFGKVKKRVLIVMGGVSLFAALLNFFTPLTGWIFTLDQNNLYHRGDLIWLNWVLVYPFQILPIFTVPFSKKEKQEKMAILLYPVAPLVTTVIQTAFYGVSVAQTGATCSALLMYIMLQSREISEHVRKQQELHEEKEIARQASEAKGRFLANMSHEIRTPINAVLGMDTMILRESKEPTIKQYAMNIQNAGQTLLSLVNDVLDISKIESGKMELVPVQYELSSLINDVFNIIKIKAEASDLTLVLDISPNLPRGLIGDDVRIRQILMNLMSNAVKYTDNGSVTLTVKEISREEAKVRIHFSIKDTGIGIKEEDIHKLFSEYQRLDLEKNRNVEGTGLGMSITYQLLSLMDSKLQVSSVYGEGSDFYFDLEQDVYDSDEIGDIQAGVAAAAENYSYSVPFIAPDAKILLVDDNQMNRDVFCGLIKDMQLQIDQAGGGIEALDKILTTQYDIVFLDHMMPDMDGIEVLKHVKTAEYQPNADTVFIALTANAIAGAREIYLKAGFEDYLSKPIIPAGLEQVLRRYLPSEKMVKSNEQAENADKMQKTVQAGSVGLPDLPIVEGVDWSFGFLHYGDEEALKKAVNSFYDMISVEANELQAMYEKVCDMNEADSENAMSQYRIKVHSMKTSANLIGAFLLSGCAAMLEFAARDGKRQQLLEMTPYFLSGWRSYKEKLAPICKVGAEDSEIIEMDAKEAAQIIKNIEELTCAVQNFDVHKADDLLDGLKKYAGVEGMEELMDSLIGYVANLDGDQVEVVGKQMIELLEERYKS